MLGYTSKINSQSNYKMKRIKLKMNKLNTKALFLSLTLFVAVAVTGLTSVQAQPPIQLQPYLTGLSSPLYVTNAKDNSNRLFVVEQGGVIKVVQPGSTTPTEFLNISDKVGAFGDGGLIGLAFHPQYASNRKFYVNYTCRKTNNPICPVTYDTIIAEFTASAANPNQADPNSERVLLNIPQGDSSHKGGIVEFGPDGYLYIGVGDGGFANDPNSWAQNRSLLLGKMLRIDVTPLGINAYRIPPDNPFLGENTRRCDNGSTLSGNTCQEIWAIGLRNPFRGSFDRGGSRQFYIGDVGQVVLEELDIITRGANYGWRVYEGTNCTGLDPSLCTPTNYTPPFYEYFNSGSPRCSVIGGYVYRGNGGALPQGTYLFGDLCTGEIMTQGSQPRNPTVLRDTTRLISSFGEDEAGEIYVVGIGSGTVEKIIKNPPRNFVADFDGDLRTDISVFRRSNGVWYVLNSSNNSVSAVQFGASNDLLAPGDFDGDGRTDVSVFRPSNGFWYSLNSSNNTFRASQFGQAGDIPVAGDYDGDGKTDLAVFRGGNWYILQSSNNAFRSQQWGIGSDQVVPADYDGDGKTDLAVRRSHTAWYILQSSNNNFRTIQFGESGDVSVPGDYDGDGKADVAVWRPSNVTWLALQSSNNALYSRQFGESGDIPAAGDYDGDGKTDPAIIRGVPEGAKVWHITSSLNAATTRSVHFGLNSDENVPTLDIP